MRDAVEDQVWKERAGYRQALGARGEAIAAAYLREAGWTIVARNWRGRAGELDLVARREDGVRPLVIVVEVKTRRSRQARPEAALTRRKRETIARLAGQFILEELEAGVSVRLDVIAVELPVRGREGAPTIRHIPGAFDAMGRVR